eukprot:6213311-Pleurochrysis_carterae.AAC.13
MHCQEHACAYPWKRELSFKDAKNLVGVYICVGSHKQGPQKCRSMRAIRSLWCLLACYDRSFPFLLIGNRACEVVQTRVRALTRAYALSYGFV